MHKTLRAGGVGAVANRRKPPTRSRRIFLPIALTILILYSAPARAAETPNRSAYTLDEVIALALAHHPLLHTQQANEMVASARVDEARTRELPKVGLSAELNRSTGNTIPGAFFPADGFPPIAGATRGKTFNGGYWQTGISAWANWDALALVRQSASVDAALAARQQSAAATDARRLEVAYRAADAYIAELEAEARLQAAKANVERARIIQIVTRTLVDQSLRPGADGARAEAEYANALTLLSRAEQSVAVQKVQLAQSVGEPTLPIDTVPTELLTSATQGRLPTSNDAAKNPDLLLSQAAVRTAKRAERTVDVEYLPRVDLVAAIWLRGSGLYGSPAQGLGPDIPNWAVGAVASWSLLDIPTIRARARSASAQTAAATAQRDEVYLDVQGQLATASAILDGAIRVAQQTPLTLAAARTAEQQAVARYKTGLAPVVDVADAQRVLVQAEIDDAVARLEVQRARLLLARAAGDLNPFLASVRKVGG